MMKEKAAEEQRKKRQREEAVYAGEALAVDTAKKIKLSNELICNQLKEMNEKVVQEMKEERAVFVENMKTLHKLKRKRVQV